MTDTETFTLKDAIEQVVSGQDLSSDQAKTVMRQIMTGKATDAQIASLLTALRMKGETIEEITAFAQVMRENVKTVENDQDTLDIVGTGGDKSFTFNISTTSSFVIAGAGIPVTKHGNRSSSSKSGSADCIEALGIELDLTPNQASQMLKEIGITFLFSQSYHPAMKYVAKTRKEIGIRTIFNVLGPLVNPANCSYQMMGVYDNKLVDKLAQVLANLGLKRAMVFGGNDGIDEITMTTTTEIALMKNGSIEHFTFDPKDYGFSYCQSEDLVGGLPEENAQITLDILKGKDRGPKRDTVICNAGLGIYLVKDDLSIQEALDQAGQIIDSGKALAKLEDMKETSHRLADKDE